MVREQWVIDEIESAWGLGVEVWKLRDRKIVGHRGAFQGFQSNLLVDLVSGFGVVVLANSIDAPVEDISLGILDTVYQLMGSENCDDAELPDYHEYEGTYRNRWSDLIVVRQGNFLRAFNPEIKYPLKNSVILWQKSGDLFRIEGTIGFASIGEVARFERDGTGNVCKLYLGATPSIKVAKV